MKASHITHLLCIALLMLLAACSQPAKPQTEAVVNPKAAALSIGWNIQTVDGGVGVSAGQSSAMALDGSGNPVIAYMYYISGGTNQVRLARCGNANCSSGNTINTIATGTNGSFISIVLDGSGNPVIAFNDNTNSTLKLLHCGDATCSSSNSIKVLDSGNVGWNVSLVLDSNGNPVISYVDFGNGRVKLAHCTDANCSSASINVAAALTSTNVGGMTSLVLDSSGNPVISLQDVHANSNTSDLKLIHCGDANCSSGNATQTIEVGGFVGGFNSLKLDSSGNPVISYFDRDNRKLKLAHCADANCGTGTTIQQVDAPPSTTVGSGSSLALNNGKPVISYYDLTNLTLKLAQCGDANCSSGNTIQTIGPAIYQGNTTSLQLDSAGNPVVSFTGGTFGAFVLNLARGAALSCAPGTYDNGSSCVPADPGYFVDTTGSSTQTPCAVGYHQPNRGSISCIKADPGNFVDKTAQIDQLPCAVGTYQPASASASCVQASVGNFVDKIGQATQTPCAVGSYQAATGQSSCKPAEAGSFVASSEAIAPNLCAVGSFQDQTGQSSCKPAPAGSYVATVGAAAATPCPVGTFSSVTGATSATTCTPAPAGSFVANAGQMAATPCPAGSYQDQAGQGTCKTATSGNFVAITGASSQTPCAVGTYQPSVGTVACITASAGNFVAAAGQANQTPCTPGSYQPNSRANSCIQASAGFYVPASGASAQIQCPSGTTSSAGATACTPITPTFNFRGFSDLRNPPALNSTKAGDEVEFEFGLGGNFGRNVVSSVGQIQINCNTLAAIGSASALSGKLSFDSGKYELEVKTPKSWAGTCRQISVTLSDGSVRPINFKFR